MLRAFHIASMSTDGPNQHRPDEVPQHSGALQQRYQLVVIPYHQHERVTGSEKLFEQPWGVEQVLAQVYAQLTHMGLLPVRIFQPGDDQWLRAEVGNNAAWAERIAQRVDRLLQAMRLPVIAFAQAVSVTPADPDGARG